MDIHSEEFEALLAEALRAGPGSPAWRQATSALRDAGEQGEDYAMLCRAREDLASGREYRSVRAGAGFTQKVMTAIEREQAKQWNVPTANIIATIAVMIVALVLVIGAWLLFSPASDVQSDEQLLETYFVNPVISEQFGTQLPEGFTRLGVLPVVIDQGARIEVQTRASDKPVGGGLLLERPIEAIDVVALESTINIERQETDLITQLFVSDRPDFAADTGLSPHELVCLVEAGHARVVLPEGRSTQEIPLASATGPATLRIRLNRDSAVVEVDNQVLWSGEHHLSTERPRFVGVRFIARGGEKSTGVAIESLKLIKP